MAQWVANLFLLLALVSATWYAWETRKMRPQMIRPKLVFFTAPHHPEQLADTQSVDLFLRNVGDGTALNVSVERLQDQNFKLRFEPEHIPVLQKQDQVLLTMHPVEGSYQPNMNLILDDTSISRKMMARYVDVEG